MKKLVKKIILVPVTLLVLNILVVRHMSPGGGGCIDATEKSQ